MSLKITNTQYYTNIANAIRSRNGSSNTYLPSEMADAIDTAMLYELPDGLRLKDIYGAITTLDLSHFYLGSRTNLDYFLDCSLQLPNPIIDISNLDFSNVTSWNNAFSFSGGYVSSLTIYVKDQAAKD